MKRENELDPQPWRKKDILQNYDIEDIIDDF